MFSTHERLIRRTGKKGVGRFEFLQQLVTEFQDTSSPEAQKQVLANLANFAYDPINYDFLRKLKVIDLFLDQLGATDESLQQFAIGGLCNLCLDSENKEYILHNQGVYHVAACLSSPNEATVLSAITTLMYLITPESKSVITSVEIIECMLRFSVSVNPRLRNLALVFLEDYCTPDQVTSVRKLLQTASIPLPRTQPPAGATPRPCCLERSTGVERWRAMTVIRGLHDGVVPLVEGNQASDTRVICERDVKLFGYISGDLNPIHFKGLPSKDGTTNHIVVHGAYLNALVSGVIGSKLPGPGTVVIAQNLRFPRPCIVGDTVTTTVQVNTVRKIVEVTFQCVVDVASENPKIVLEGSAKLIIPATMGSSSN